ncbi:hypothetical protein RA2_04288 [Roseovarius sp. A-2]|uniref:hypothetical protein n=1 Tax=Roseovarius sp. A-2 TaxID=1570360 RepID=UPI0009B511D0|nr:hypothetical protein [Roseovarius sp. A-2]GAW37212.1 hypothetical protein RA2_04288 [Roseovarius sp. A-2]
MKRKERELNQPDGLATAIKKKTAKTLGEVIQAYIESQNGQIGKSKLQNLSATCRFEIAHENAETLACGLCHLRGGSCSNDQTGSVLNAH